MNALWSSFKLPLLLLVIPLSIIILAEISFQIPEQYCNFFMPNYKTCIKEYTTSENESGLISALLFGSSGMFIAIIYVGYTNYEKMKRGSIT